MINNISQLKALASRFLEGKCDDPYEWDDFLSLKNDNPEVEFYRNKIGEYEYLLFSKRKQDFEKYRILVGQLVDEINQTHNK